MSYRLYGSPTSPYVRKIRLLMENIPYELIDMNIYEGQDAVEINKINPMNQIPVLYDDEQPIWDSRQIFYYLQNKHGLGALSLREENFLSAIDGAMDAAITLLLMKRSGIQINEPLMYIVRLKDRIESVLDYLRPYLQNDALKDWNFVSMSLYCFLDWGIYRHMINIENRPECEKFLQQWRSKRIVDLTQLPRI